ncbi:MAG: HD domain-containing protein [Rhodospirillales bacterium]|nr:HD domain-containing protein [Rhodospirillales bacterium]MBO6787324.1 HD domain-containing protein [Rhodospirillales bacterium]
MTDVTVDTIFEALETAGHVRYGTEAISELEHALQIADLADEMSGDPELIAGALLHDIGRVAVRQEDVSDTLVPDHMGKTNDGAKGHDTVGADLLAEIFPDRVLAGIRLHVAAKRYLCTVEPEYRDRISDGSELTLKMQGGLMDDGELEAFRAMPYADDAVQIRRWDDLAKVPGKPSRPLEHWRPLLESLMR